MKPDCGCRVMWKTGSHHPDGEARMFHIEICEGHKAAMEIMLSVAPVASDDRFSDEHVGRVYRAAAAELAKKREAVEVGALRGV